MYEQLTITGPQTTIAKKTRDMVAAYDRQIDEAENRAADLESLEKGLFDDLPQTTPHDIRHKRMDLEDATYQLALDVHALAVEREDVIREIIEAIQNARPKLEKTVEKLQTETAEALEKAGYGPEKHPRFQHNPEGIRRQFQAKVDDADPVRRARTALAQCNSDEGVAHEQLRACRDLLASAQADLVSAAAKILQRKPPAARGQTIVDPGRHRGATIATPLNV